MHFLATHGHAEKADSLAKLLELQARLVKVDKRQHKHIFDIILNV